MNECLRPSPNAIVADNSVTRTLALALHSIGGEERLAAFFGVTAAVLREWLDGRSEPPIDIYLRSLDLVAKGPFAFRTNGGNSGDKR